VVSFDDTPESRHSLPPLTTVHQDFEAVGRLAVKVLVARVAGAPPRSGFARSLRDPYGGTRLKPLMGGTRTPAGSVRALASSVRTPTRVVRADASWRAGERSALAVNRDRTVTVRA
jgi:hypothetical protein